MEQALDQLLTTICWGYVGSVILLTYLILSFITIEPKSHIKIFISIGVGIVLGVAWYLLDKTQITSLFYSFLFQAVFYNWIIKAFMKKIGDTYKNGRGIV